MVPAAAFCRLDESIQSQADDLTPLYARRLAAMLYNFVGHERNPRRGAAMTRRPGDGPGEVYQLHDTHRRIRNILDAYPATDWNLAESKTVLAALAGIVRGRPEPPHTGRHLKLVTD